LVKLLVYRQVFGQFFVTGKLQHVPVTQLPRRFERAVFIKIFLNFAGIDFIQPGSQISCPQIRPQDVVAEDFFVLCSCLPVATFNVRVNRAKYRTLLFQ